jgi:hypothetical protein
LCLAFAVQPCLCQCTLKAQAGHQGPKPDLQKDPINRQRPKHDIQTPKGTLTTLG